jgi:hypothetical protein
MNKKVATMIAAVLFFIATQASADILDVVSNKPGVQPIDDTLDHAAMYCREVYRFYLKRDALEKAAEWSGKITMIAHRQIAYHDGDDGIPFGNVTAYANKYEEHTSKKLAQADDPIEKAIERLKNKKK